VFIDKSHTLGSYVTCGSYPRRCMCISFRTLEELKLANNPKLEAFIKETSAFATFAQLPHLRRFDLFELP